MSFQDFGKQPRSHSNRPTGSTYPITTTTSGSFDGGTSSSSHAARIGSTAAGGGYNGMNATAGAAGDGGSGGEYAALSDAILQYQVRIFIYVLIVLYT